MDTTMDTVSVIEDENFKAVGEGTLDGRNRVGLTKAIEAVRALLGNISLEGVRFAISCNSAGQILLSPKTTIPLHEAWLYRNKAAFASVRRGLQQAARGEVESLGSFGKFADDEID